MRLPTGRTQLIYTVVPKIELRKAESETGY